MAKQGKLSETAKLGHTKVSDERSAPCIVCGEPAHFVKLNYPVRKANGAVGQGTLRAHLHAACVEDL